MYESPIQMISEDIIKDIVEKQNGYIIEIVHRMGFDVDEEEIKKALTYDRNQWERGYVDGKMDGYHLRDVEIVRCEECKHYIRHDKCCGKLNHGVHTNFYCADGVRRNDAEVH